MEKPPYVTFYVLDADGKLERQARESQSNTVTCTNPDYVLVSYVRYSMHLKRKSDAFTFFHLNLLIPQSLLHTSPPLELFVRMY